MSIDSSLKSAAGLAGHRNVLTRAERVEKLKATRDMDFKKKPVIGLPKTGNRAGKR
ncbi:MAG: small basic protein [Phycisphaeraceae bacterium]|nr:small basic protein [Phycisphaeraceae bacterium]MCB9848004.1 small basic protein [Phycisphaeraceae bacterium]